MKKSLIFMTILALGSVWVLIRGTAFVSAEKEEVAITERVVSGDRSAAEDVIFSIGTCTSEGLIWDTDCRVGGESSTEFRYFGKQSGEEYRTYFEREIEWGEEEPLSHIYHDIDLELPVQSRVEGFGTTISMTSSLNAELAYYPKAWEALLQNATPGRTFAGEVSVADYYDIYPLELWLTYDFANTIFLKGDEKKMGQGYDVTDFLGIPVPEGQKMTAEITCGADGRIEKVAGSGTEGGVEIRSVQTSLEQGCYFSFHCESSGQPVPWESEAGNGIYFVPATKEGTEEGGKASLWYDRMVKICSLPEDCFVEKLLPDPAGERIGLLVLQDGKWRLDSLNPEDGSLVPGGEMSLAGGNGEPEIRRVGERWFIALPGEFSLLREGKEGAWEEEMGESLAAEGAQNLSGGGTGEAASETGEAKSGAGEVTSVAADPFYWDRDYALAYQDGRLALFLQESTASCGGDLFVFGASGTLYHGVYEHGGDTLNNGGFGNWIRPWARNAFRVAFE